MVAGGVVDADWDDCALLVGLVVIVGGNYSCSSFYSCLFVSDPCVFTGSGINLAVYWYVYCKNVRDTSYTRLDYSSYLGILSTDKLYKKS